MSHLKFMTANDLETTVEVHLRSFEGFFLASLGGPFLKEFYRAMQLDDSTIALVSERDGSIVGFVVGTLRPDGLYKRALSRSWFRLLRAAIVPVIRKPGTALRLLRRLFVAHQFTYEEGEALLLSLAVLPSEQGRGIGHQLVAAFLEEAKKRGAASISLTTDKLGNDSVNQFYLRSGFQRRQAFVTPEGREMNEYFLGIQAQA